MELTLEQVNRLFYLFGALRDEIITPQEFSELNEFLKTYPIAQDYYLDYMYLCTDLCNLQAAIKHASAAKNQPQACRIEAEEDDYNSPPLTLDILKVLGDYEKQAEALELPAPEPPEEDTDRTLVIKKSTPKVSKLSIFSLITSLAALLFIIAYPLLFPPPPVGVAFVSDTIDAKWSSLDSLENGTRLTAGADPIQIIKGLVKIQTDNGAHLVLEAPAEFRFTNSDELSMNYGRIFVNVKKASNGFIVQTNKSKIIDIGTQFGVYTDMRGETELHVFEGKTVLIAGLHSKADQAVDVVAGQARKFGKSLTEVQTITLSERFFVRDIESKANRIWRTEKQINLADIVGGGDGLGTGKINTGINPSNRPDDKIGEMRDRKSANQYNPVPTNPYIDGVFVPDGTTDQVITSAGHIFKDCPATSTYFFADILNTPTEIPAMDQAQSLSFAMDSISSSNKDACFLCIHANSGITFDLNTLRSRFRGNQIHYFRSTLKVLDAVPDKNNIESAADFWILIDGKVQYENTLQRGMADFVELEIAESDRFLTLVTTDGGYRDKELDRNAIGYDWCIFDQPKLILE